MKKLKSNKGFTLIELLAVIVILGVLMIVAIPMVSQYIREAKQNAFISTAKAYVQSARYGYLNGDYTEKDEGSTDCATLDSATGGDVYIKFKYIPVDKTGGKSSFGKTIDMENSYVHIHSNGSNYTYYVYMRDESNNGFVEKKEDELKKKDVVATITGASASFDANKACKHESYTYSAS